MTYVPFLSRSFPFVTLIVLLTVLRVVTRLLDATNVAVCVTLLDEGSCLAASLDTVGLNKRFRGVMKPSLFTDAVATTGYILPTTVNVTVALTTTLPEGSRWGRGGHKCLVNEGSWFTRFTSSGL